MTLLAHDNNKSCSGKLKAVNLSQDNKDKTHWPVTWVGVFTSLIIKLRVNANEFSTDTVSCSFLQSHTFKVSNCKDKGMFCWEKAEKVYFCTIFAIFQLNTFVPECSYLWMLKCSLWMQWDVSSVWPPSDDRLTESHSLFSLRSGNLWPRQHLHRSTDNFNIKYLYLPDYNSCCLPVCGEYKQIR